MTAFPRLLSPFALKGLELRNRIFSSGHETLIVTGGIPDEKLAAYHEDRARGGAALIITEATTVHATAYFNSSMPIGYREDCIPGFRLVAEAIHRHGARVFGQLFHPGGEMMGMGADGTRPVAWAPSAYNHERYLGRARAMPSDMVEEVVAGYGITAANLVAAGYDGVEIVASHGYLPGQFLSARINRREDKWGGSDENRRRFIMEAARAVRAAVPAHVVLGLRISLGEKTEAGMDRAEAMGAIHALQDAGLIDYVNMTVGSSGTSHANDFVISPMNKPAGFMNAEVQGAREGIRLPVMVVGRYNQPQPAEQALESGLADMVGMTRAQISDPELANKLRDGRLDDIRACIACNQACVGHLYFGAPVSCIQRPETGRELEYGTRRPASRRRKVLIAGAGPAGLKAAAVAAERGHEVVLCEASSRVGGQVTLAQLIPGRAEFGGLVTNLSRELELAGVRPRLNTVVDAALVRREAPDAVVVATGATPLVPELPGGSDGHVVTAWQVLAREANCGGSVVVVDWRSDWIGLGVAQFLAREGRRVRLMTSSPAPGLALPASVRDVLVAEATGLGVEIVPNARLYGVDGSTAWFEQALSREPIVAEGIDTTVLALGHEAADGLHRELAGLGVELHLIGDALTPRTAEEAVLEGLKVGAAL